VAQARKAAQTPATVLLRGESGTGKELFAHAIHNESDRKYNPFVRVNCAALSETLLESELFGYEDGAFTGAKRGGKRGLFEEASGGTLFLDEIGEMSVATQAKLLRALQEREIMRVGGTKPIPVDVRVIAATHVNLEQAVAAGKFREDLYYRLNVVPIVIPPLRYRLEDLESLAMHIIFRQNQAFGRNVTSISKDAVDVLSSYDWPGNVRELENTIGRAMIRMGYQETCLEAYHLPVLKPQLGSAVLTPGDGHFVPKNGTLQQIVQQVEKSVIERVLSEVGGSKAEAARRLGISVRTLYYKLRTP
jgi:transcriptional regulator with PAS, ATPase and Fis domain